MATESLFNQVVQILGLSMIIGPGLVKRSLAGAGAPDPATTDVNAYRRALPEIEQRLKSYMSESEAAGRIAKIRALLDAA